jgi:DNA polymerase III subunit beta
MGAFMKFTCEKNLLQKEISFAQEIIASKSSISVLSNVFIEAKNETLSIKATDIKVNFATSIPISVQEEGTSTIFCDKLLGILSSIPEGEIEIEQNDMRISIKPVFKKIKFQLRSISPDKFPEFPGIEDSKYFSFPVKEFKEMIENTIFAVSDDETRYFMNGVFMEKVGNSIIMVATDGKRLAYIKKELESEIQDFKSAIIPPKILSIILRHAGDQNPISLAIGEKNLHVKFGNYKLSSVLIEGQFPNYQRVIPESQKYSIFINRNEILDALKRVSILVEQKSRRTLFTIANTYISLSTEENEIGDAKEEISCRYEGPDTLLALNYKYLEEPLKSMNDEEIEIDFTEPTRAITICSAVKKDFFHIIMPMQLE